MFSMMLYILIVDSFRMNSMVMGRLVICNGVWWLNIDILGLNGMNVKVVNVGIIEMIGVIKYMN